MSNTDKQIAENLQCLKTKVEKALLSNPLVDDCAVLIRETGNHQPELVAYIVSSWSISSEKIQSQLQEIVPKALLPKAYVPVSTIPLTDTGVVDEATLACLEVIDSDLIRSIEEQLQSLPEIDRVAVVVEPLVKSIPPLHLDDLLPDRQALTTEDSQTQAQATIPSKKIENKRSLNAKKLAISHGEPLHYPEDAPKTLGEVLQRTAQQSTKGIVYIQSDGSEKFQSYQELWQDAQRILAGLKQLGLKPQDKVIFQLEQNQDFISAFWGCVLGGFVPVPISIAPTYEQVNSTTSKLQNTWQMLEKPLVLTGTFLASKIRSFSELLNLKNFQVETIDHLRQYEPDFNWHSSQPEDLAILLLTSGSTDTPKAVMQSHRSLLSRSAATASMNNFTSNDVSLNWFPLDHVGGLVMFHIRDIYVSCQQINAPTQLVLQDPLLWLNWIERYRATITWAPNFAYGLINDRAQEVSKRCWDLSQMRFILNGGEAIVAKHARKFLQLLTPHGLSATVMHPSWGMSETCSGVVFSYNFSLDTTTDDDSFVEVGAPIPGISLRIVDDLGQVVEEETIGRVQIKGNPITSGYYQNPELNQEVFTQDGWFITGDLGFLRFGRLTITGRQKDVIIINGLNYYSHEIESAVEELEGVEVSFTAAVGVRDAFDHTDKLAIFFSPAIASEAGIVNLTKEIRSQVIQKIGVNPAYLIPVDKEVISKTAIGKIQRSQLRMRFEAGEFNNILKRLDILLNNPNTLPDWFYRKIWRFKEAATNTAHLHIGPYLVFLDRLGLGKFICRELNRRNQPYVTVETGLNFAKLNRDCYCIHPNEPDHYRHLLECLKADDFRIGQILHLWTYDDYAGEVSSLEALENAQQQGIYSLLFLIQALDKVQGSEHSVHLEVISSYAQFTSATDKIAYEKSTLIGFVKTVPIDVPWLQCRHIDLEVESVEVNAEHILRELSVSRGDSEIAYRNGRRLSSSLVKVDMLQQKTQEIPLKPSRIYLVTGGLGGIGTYLSQFLLKEYGAKLIIVGRTELPNRTEWSKHLGQKTRLAKRIKNYQTIEAAGGEFIYKAVDICDLESLRKVVAEASLKWNEPLSGIIHLAGEGNSKYHWKTIEEHWLTVETPNTFDSMLRPKVHGTWTLYQLIKNNPQALFISFSSINSLFGAATFSAYSAANSFLDCCSLYQRYHLHPQSYCFNWTLWDDLGMSQGNPEYAREAARGMGYYIISKEQGLSSLLAALYRTQTQLIVGLDGSNLNIRRYTDNKFCTTQKLTAYFTASSSSSVVKLPDFRVQDRFGTQSTCNLVQLLEMPLTLSGAIDREKLVQRFTRQEAGDRVAPRNQVERQIAQIWQQVLGIPLLSVHDNFFELGGNSLLATQLISHLRDTFSVELSLHRLFASPSVADLAHTLEALRTVAEDGDAFMTNTEEEYEEGYL